MTRDETKKIVFIIHGTYPNSYKNISTENTSLQIDIWQSIFTNHKYSEVEIALKAYMKTETKGFPPSPGQIIDMLHIPDRANFPNEMEAWSLVSRALRNGYYGSEEEFAKLPPIVQKSVGSPSQLRNWSQTDSDSVENVIQSNFLRTYRTEVIREKEYEKIPEEVKYLIGYADQPTLISAT